MPEASLLELDLEGLIGVMEELGQPAYRARQLYRQIWQRGALDPAEMSDLPRELRAELAARAAAAPTPLATQTSADGSTTKALVPLADGEMVETVLIRHEPQGQGTRSSPTQTAHGLPLDAGRLRDGLHVLRDRRAGLPPAAHSRRGTGAGAAGASLGA